MVYPQNTGPFSDTFGSKKLDAGRYIPCHYCRYMDECDQAGHYYYSFGP